GMIRSLGRGSHPRGARARGGERGADKETMTTLACPQSQRSPVELRSTRGTEAPALPGPDPRSSIPGGTAADSAVPGPSAPGADASVGTVSRGPVSGGQGRVGRGPAGELREGVTNEAAPAASGRAITTATIGAAHDAARPVERPKAERPERLDSMRAD